MDENGHRKLTDDERQDLRDAVHVLRLGGIILYPTDTIWGLGCDATNPEAVERIYRLKQRAESKSMLTLMQSFGQIERYVQDPEDVAFELMEVADKPLTVIFPGAKGLAPNLIAEDGSVGIRLTREPFSRGLIMGLGRPIVSTSANISGQPAPAVFPEISKEILEGVDYVCKYRRDDLTRHAPSGIIKIDKGGVFKIIR